MRIRLALLLACASVPLCLAAQPVSTWGSTTWGDASMVPLPTGPMLAQQADIEATNVSSIRAQFAAPNVAGRLIVAFVRMSTATQTVKLTDSAGDVFIQAVAQEQTADGSQIHIFYARAKGGINAVTAAFSAANTHPWLAIYEFAGVSTLDQKASAQGKSTAPKASVTAKPFELVFVGTGLPSSFTGSAVAGPGLQISQQDTGHSRAAVSTAAITLPITVSATFTFSTAANWSIAVATFK